MKKLLTLLLLLLLTLSLAACGGGDPADGNGNGPDGGTEDGGNTDNGGTEDGGSTDGGASTDKVKMDEIVFSSPFCEGVAFVAIESDPYTAYCINKQGETLFRIEDCAAENTERGVIELGLRFKNGLMLFDGNLYDKTGKLTTPESLGATGLLQWDGTYLIAEKITSDYASATKELGVLDKDLKWVRQPSEGDYTAYYADTEAFLGLLAMPEEERAATVSIIDDAVYRGLDKLFDTDDVGAGYLIGVHDGKYVYAGANSGIGILTLDGKWFLEPCSYGSILHDEHLDWLEREVLTDEKRERSCLFSKRAARIFINDGSVIDAEDLGVVSILAASNDYILVRVTGEAHYPAVGVMDYSRNWVVAPSGANYDSYNSSDDIGFVGHYMVMDMGKDGVYYYDLKTNTLLDKKPADLPTVEEAPKDEPETEESGAPDLTGITNYRTGSSFIGGKAAVILMNPETGELFITVVNEKLEFLFEPVKLDRLASQVHYLDLKFDGEHAIVANTYLGTAQNPLLLCAYNTAGEMVVAFSTSMFEMDSATSVTFDYGEGVFVFSFNYGTYSAYYRESDVRYYSLDGKPYEW